MWETVWNLVELEEPGWNLSPWQRKIIVFTVNDDSSCRGLKRYPVSAHEKPRKRWKRGQPDELLNVTPPEKKAAEE